MDQVVELVGGWSVINGAYPVQFLFLPLSSPLCHPISENGSTFLLLLLYMARSGDWTALVNRFKPNS